MLCVHTQAPVLDIFWIVADRKQIFLLLTGEFSLQRIMCNSPLQSGFLLSVMLEISPCTACCKSVCICTIFSICLNSEFHCTICLLREINKKNKLWQKEESFSTLKMTIKSTYDSERFCKYGNSTALQCIFIWFTNADICSNF